MFITYTNPFTNPHHPSSPHHSCSLSVVPAVCPASLYQPRITAADTQVQAQCRSLDDGDLAPPAHCVLALALSRCAGSSHGHGGVSSRATTSTSGVNTIVHGMDMGIGGASLIEAPQNWAAVLVLLMALDVLGRAGRRLRTDSRCVCTRVPPTQSVEELNAPDPDLGFLRSSRALRKSRNDGHHHCTSSRSSRFASTDITSNTSTGSPPQAISPPM